MIAAIVKICDVVPGWIWALICAALLGLMVVDSIGAAAERTKLKEALAKEVKAHADTKLEYAGYREEAERLARVAEVKRREVELDNFRNSERTASEQAKREAQYASAERRLRDAEQRLRSTDETVTAGIARDSSSGNTAGLAATAADADQLYRACRDEYREMGRAAERVRIQALGLWEYIRGNSMCSTPFGPGVTEPVK